MRAADPTDHGFLQRRFAGYVSDNGRDLLCPDQRCSAVCLAEHGGPQPSESNAAGQKDVEAASSGVNSGVDQEVLRRA